MSLRLFVALELPDPVRAALAAWCPADAALRPVREEALHVTLAFLGAREEPDAEGIGRLLAPLARPVADLALDGAHWLPPRRPGILAAGVADGDGALGGLRSELVAALAAEMGFAPERRAFLAHVTVARVRAGARVGRGLRDAADPPRIGFAAPAVTLFASRLGSGGARYEALARVALS